MVITKVMVIINNLQYKVVIKQKHVSCQKALNKIKKKIIPLV